MMMVLAVSVLQTMTFYLRTGYGVSQQGFGGSPDDPTFGLGQGNGMAPSGYSHPSTSNGSAEHLLSPDIFRFAIGHLQ
jgi:hypothetical protein